MKLTINQGINIPEPEIILNCSRIDRRLGRLVEQIRQYNLSLTGYTDDLEYQLPLDQIYYIDSADGKTFLYTEKEVFGCREPLYRLEEKLCSTSIVRISRSCLMNTVYLQYVRPMYNHRLEAHMKSGESLIVTRNYIEKLRDKLKESMLSR